jgi:cell division protein FtsI (penicillin-binding protein 3)
MKLYKAVGRFQAEGRGGLVVNVHTGEILGMASYPTFDPNQPGKASLDARLRTVRPGAVYEMARPFKASRWPWVSTRAWRRRTSTFDARSDFHLGYRTIHDYHATRKILTLVEVFQHSSNIGTARLAEAVGVERLSHYFKAFGLTEPAKVELIETARPLTPKVWNEDAVASTSFGHGMNVSPLALARAYSGILNGGKLLPLTIKKLPAGPRSTARASSPKRPRRPCCRSCAPTSAARAARAARPTCPGLNVGGKTGTGEKYDPGDPQLQPPSRSRPSPRSSRPTGR